MFLCTYVFDDENTHASDEFYAMNQPAILENNFATEPLSYYGNKFGKEVISQLSEKKQKTKNNSCLRVSKGKFPSQLASPRLPPYAKHQTATLIWHSVLGLSHDEQNVWPLWKSQVLRIGTLFFLSEVVILHSSLPLRRRRKGKEIVNGANDKRSQKARWLTWLPLGCDVKGKVSNLRQTDKSYHRNTATRTKKQNRNKKERKEIENMCLRGVN